MADTIFYNADYIVIEYIDLIKNPYLVLLSQIRRNHKIREILKIEEIENLSSIGLYEWYIQRKHMNFFMDLNRYPDQISQEQMDSLLNDQINLTMQFYEFAVPLNIIGPLKRMKRSKLAKDIIIYHPHNNLFAKRDLELITGEKFTFMSDFNHILDIAKENSTYFLSDIDKIMIMKEKGFLACSSITLPIEYRYNKKNSTEFKYDMDELFKESPFKLSYMRACTDDTPEKEDKK